MNDTQNTPTPTTRMPTPRTDAAFNGIILRIDDARELMKQLECELATAKEQLAEWDNAAKFAADEKCTASEHHCACVPILREQLRQRNEEIKRLEQRAEAAEQLQRNECAAMLKLLDDAGVPCGNANDRQGWDVRIMWLIQKRDAAEKVCAEYVDLLQLGTQWLSLKGRAEWEEKVKSAINGSSAGSSYIPKSQLDAAKNALELCVDSLRWWKKHERLFWGNSAEQALEAAEKAQKGGV